MAETPKTPATPPAPVERVVTSGVFRRGDAVVDVQTNVWIVSDGRKALAIDPAHDYVEIVRALGDRELMAIVCTHGHNDHIDSAVELNALTGAPLLLHPDDEDLWNEVFPGRPPDAPLLHGEALQVGGIELDVLHTPGHTPGSVSLHCPALGAVFSGDTPAAQLAGVPPQTAVYPGHGESALR